MFSILILLALLPQSPTPSSRGGHASIHGPGGTLCSADLAIKSCHSFEEMVRAKDSVIMEALAPDQQAYICLDPKQDHFTVISFVPPKAEDFTESDGHKHTAPGFLSWAVYTDGISVKEEIWFGEWVYNFGSANAAVFTSGLEDSTKPGALISPTEIQLQYSGKNHAGSDTTATVFIRRSTMRFLERLSPLGIETTGHCLHFPRR